LIDFDNSATTPLCRAALNAFAEAAAAGGNPSSLHALGMSAAQRLEAARETVANALGAPGGRVVFTSGGTEANNLALIGAASVRRRLGNRIVSTAAEHASVFETLLYLEKQGFETVLLAPDRSGRFDEDEIQRAVTPETILVSVIHTNNETGTYSPFPAFARAVSHAAQRAKKKSLLHCDAVQAFGKEPLSPRQLGADLLTVSAHKVFGPKGIGALYIGENARVHPLLHGGGQEKGLRPGTEPVELACAFAAAVRDFGDLAENREKVRRVRERILRGLAGMEGITVHSPDGGSPYILNFSAGTVRSETMLHFLEAREIYVSSGSACAKGKPSRVLSAMGVPAALGDCALRVSLSKHSTEDEADRFIEVLREGLKTLASKR
jgi:cysteine desulfurase